MFERYVVVDWSANSTPKRGRDSIWVAVLEDGGLRLSNPATRSDATASLAELIAGDRVTTLIGVDFSLGYPAGTAAAVGLEGRPWEAMWSYLAAEVIGGERNRNNRFDVAAGMNQAMSGGPAPFWGCPPSVVSATLTATKPTGVPCVEEWRAVERVLRACGRRPFSSWQLIGAGAVGSQSLLGIPTVEHLRKCFADRVEVWPFTTGLRSPVLRRGAVVVAEVWPSLRPFAVGDGEVRDRAQVAAVARWMNDADRDGELARCFSPNVAAADVDAVVSEEGWILGVEV